jgi:DnaJ-class molecular chaperone
MPRLGARTRGDLWVRVEVEIPRDPSRAIRKLYEQIKDLESS